MVWFANRQIFHIRPIVRDPSGMKRVSLFKLWLKRLISPKANLWYNNVFSEASLHGWIAFLFIEGGVNIYL